MVIYLKTKNLYIGHWQLNIFLQYFIEEGIVLWNGGKMSIKLLKKLVNHEIKRFYVKNKLEQKEVIFHSKGEFKVHFITPKFISTAFQKQQRIFELKMNKNISKTKMKYLVLLYYIKELLENFDNDIL